MYSTIWENTNHEWPVFIDTSKRVDWCRRFLNLEGVRTRFVHLIRDPRALVRRWLLSYTKGSQHRHARWVTMKREPRHALSVLLASRPRMYLYKWLQKNSQISRFLEPRRADSLVVTYQDLALSPEREIRRITEGLGLTFEPGQLEYWTREHHGSQKTTYEWVKKDKVRHFDVRWKEFLSDRFQASIEKDAVLQRYLTSQDLHLTADGLTRSLTRVIGEGQ